MPNIEDIKSFMNSWKQHTYKQGLEYCRAIKKGSQVYQKTLEVLEKQKLACKYMNGESVCNIPIKEEGKVDIIFSDIFWELARRYITPVNYIATIVDKCIEKNITDTYEIAGIVGRGLRAFPSFLREMDLTYKISKHFPGARIEMNPTQDVHDHTDILIKTNDCEYRIWSYQNFERGLTNTASRFKEERGNIPKGVHVLCPINIGNVVEREEVDGWFFYSERYVKYLYEMIVFESPDNYSFVSRMSDAAIKAYLRKANTVEK